ncbi:PEP-CTERM sorting domain-containing protein [Nostoc sp. FACHB-280]|uniref:PEP-CTERM sorting domain-containing protein n=1 Tax=Nostoc sp. FACHB-280 TaxID=2692839 RepID=UPI00168B4911|nr:PEP-CTERM sorting domain-containing protein [Nostoc sp. FACHB-280]MBD2495699.1 PEP-CTERM sorting domain-containing protein [Nostoc sp. FACHB-280]
MITLFTVKKELLKVCSIAAVATLAAGTITTAQAQQLVLTFDDLEPTNSVFEELPIPNGYGGLNWRNFGYLDTVLFNANPSGYINGTISSPNVAFNRFGVPATVSRQRGLFDFNSAYLTGAWNNNLKILVEGFASGITKYSTTVTVNSTSPTQINFDFLGIDTLRFTSFGGINAGYGGLGSQMVLDNFSYTPQPVSEPTNILGLITAASFGVASRSKKRQEPKAIGKN